VSKFDEIWDYVKSKGDIDDDHTYLVIFCSDMEMYRRHGFSITGETWIKTPEGPRPLSHLGENDEKTDC